jgi:hypothetical protein
VVVKYLIWDPKISKTDSAKIYPTEKNLGLPWFSMVLNVFHWFSIGLSGPLVPPVAARSVSTADPFVAASLTLAFRSEIFSSGFALTSQKMLIQIHNIYI